MGPTRGVLLARGCLRLSPPAYRRISTTATVPAESELLKRRKASPKYITKVMNAENDWEKRANQIKHGEIQNTWDMLEERGFIKDVAG